MTKRNKIIYWMASAWLAVGMLLLLPVLLLLSWFPGPRSYEEKNRKMIPLNH